VTSPQIGTSVVAVVAGQCQSIATLKPSPRPTQGGESLRLVCEQHPEMEVDYLSIRSLARIDQHGQHALDFLPWYPPGCEDSVGILRTPSLSASSFGGTLRRRSSPASNSSSSFLPGRHDMATIDCSLSQRSERLLHKKGMPTCSIRHICLL